MYRPAAISGDHVPVPQLVFSKLTAHGADDARFRVALYVLATGQVAIKKVAQELHLSERVAEKALEYWEGAGLLERVASGQPTAALAFTPKTRQRLTTREAAQASQDDPMLGGLVTELQRIFGGVISQKDCDIFMTLYVVDKLPPDLILMAASHCASQNKISARYIEKMLLAWQREGIRDSAAADAYLKLLEQRETQQQQIAQLMGISNPGFSLTDKKKIAQWFEEYGYGLEMVEAARLRAGDKQNEIRYLDAILRKWFSKGYKNHRDVQQEENHNLRVQGDVAVAPQDDILMNAGSYVPLKRREMKMP